MKIRAVAFAFLLGQAFTGISYASCEATIIGGSHSAPTIEEAESGAWEDARDACYPGEAEPVGIDCSEKTASANVADFLCKQTVSCTLCGDDLKRKYEALD